MEEYIELLQKVGLTTFVVYYNVYKTHYNQRSNLEILAAFQENEELFNQDSAATKASKGKKIFRINKNIDALYYIANEAQQISFDVKHRAGRILEAENTNQIVED